MTPDKPWKDENRLRRMYHAENMSMPEIADALGCSYRTVYNWMDKFDIERRSVSKSVSMAHNRKPAPFFTDESGYEHWQTNNLGDRSRVRVSRLLAVAEWGFDAVSGKVVHHKNDISWDNRPDNLGVMDRSEHMRLHHERGDYEDAKKGPISGGPWGDGDG